MIDLVPLVNKTVDFAYRGARLRFDLSHALFSSYAVDTGTSLLLKEIAHDEVIARSRAILDAGCGAGIIGIALAASCPDAKIVMKDRDILACAFAERNCWRNGIAARRFDIEGRQVPPIQKKAPKHKNRGERRNEVLIAPGLLGDREVFGPFDAIVSNLPAKAGAAVLSDFMRSRAKESLKPGGRFAFVIVNTLAEFAGECCAFSDLALIKKTAGRGHTVFVLEKPAAQAVSADASEAAAEEAARGENADRGALPLDFAGSLQGLEAYERSAGARKLGRHAVKARGYWGLPEFDTASYATELAVEALESACAGSLVRDFFVAEPGIGLAALWADKVLGPARIHLMSRDLLALRASAANLKAFGAPRLLCLPLQSIDMGTVPDASMDAVLWFPDEVPEYDYVSSAWEFMSRVAKKGAALVIVARSTVAARFQKPKPSGMQRRGEKKKKGFSALVFRREG